MEQKYGLFLQSINAQVFPCEMSQSLAHILIIITPLYISASCFFLSLLLKTETDE